MGAMKNRSRGKNAETGMQQGPKQNIDIFSAAVFPPMALSVKKRKHSSVQFAIFRKEMEGIVLISK